jgi:hypothetical protein
VSVCGAALSGSSLQAAILSNNETVGQLALPKLDTTTLEGIERYNRELSAITASLQARINNVANVDKVATPRCSGWSPS